MIFLIFIIKIKILKLLISYLIIYNKGKTFKKILNPKYIKFLLILISDN